MADNNKVLKY